MEDIVACYYDYRYSGNLESEESLTSVRIHFLQITCISQMCTFISRTPPPPKKKKNWEKNKNEILERIPP